MPGLAIEIWIIVAEFVDRNPFEYLRVSQVCRASRVALLRDELWRAFTPCDLDQPLAAAFVHRLSRKPPHLRRAILKNYSAARGEPSKGCVPAPPALDADLDYQLSLAAAGAVPLSECELPRFWECCLALNPNSYEVAPAPLRANADFTLRALAAGVNPFMIPTSVLEHPRVSPAAVEARAMVLTRMSKSYIEANRQMVARAVELDAWALSAAHKFRDDREIVATAIAQHGQALGFASPRLQGDPSLVLQAVSVFGIALRYAPDLQNNRQIVLAAVENCGGALEFASAALKADKQIVLQAVKNDPESRKWAPPKLQFDPDIVMATLMKMRH